MNLGVVGSRNFVNYNLLSKVLSEYKPDKIISGGADGADCLAWFYAKENHIPIQEYLPEVPRTWAYMKRNRQIVENSDFLIAFQKNNSRGTGSTIGMAIKEGIRGRIIKTRKGVL